MVDDDDAPEVKPLVDEKPVVDDDVPEEKPIIMAVENQVVDDDDDAPEKPAVDGDAPEEKPLVDEKQVVGDDAPEEKPVVDETQVDDAETFAEDADLMQELENELYRDIEPATPPQVRYCNAMAALQGIDDEMKGIQFDTEAELQELEKKFDDEKHAVDSEPPKDSKKRKLETAIDATIDESQTGNALELPDDDEGAPPSNVNDNATAESSNRRFGCGKCRHAMLGCRQRNPDRFKDKPKQSRAKSSA